MPLYLYEIPKKIWLTDINQGIRNNNLSFTEQDFRVYKGAHFSIDFIVRNNDRKPIKLMGKSLTITILDHESRQSVIQKNLDILDELAGKAQLTLTPNETASLDVGFYNYTVLIVDENNVQKILYVDQDRDANGWFEIRDGALPQLATSQDSGLPSSWTPVHIGDYPGGGTQYISSALKGDAQLGQTDGLHTIAIYTTNFTGKFWIEGSLELSPPSSDDNWFNVHVTPNKFELLFSSSTSVHAFNFEGNLMWIRFRYEADTLNTGTIDQVLLKP